MPDYDATIYALSSGPPPSGVAVVRLSGRGVRFGLETLCGRIPDPRRAVLRRICDPHGSLIDTGLVLYFPGPSSFTGEDCAEFHVHGGRAVISAILQALSDLPEFRPAEAGEFTRRAFENGRLDLTAVEGLSDLVAAETEMQRRLALQAAEGRLATQYDNWAEALTRTRALLEAGIDFADEDDVPEQVSAGIRCELDTMRAAVAAQLARVHAGEVVRDGFRIAIVGAPNVGKSSLMNALASRDISIVSAEPGTTRDIVSVVLDIGGYAVVVHDTAGLREAPGTVEREGIRRARQAMADSDLVLLLSDEPGAGLPEQLAPKAAALRVRTKSDLFEGDEPPGGVIAISAVTGAGLTELIDTIGVCVAQAAGSLAEAIPARERQRGYLKQVLGHLDRVVLDDALPVELAAEELRGAAHALGRITGRVDVEDLLGVIFASFCIGK